MRTLFTILLVATLALATETIDGVNAPNPAKFSWNAGTKTATLLVDLNEDVVISGAGVVLDGDGHAVTGPGVAGVGIDVARTSGVTVRNCVVTGWNQGVRVWGTSALPATGACIAGNTVTGNATHGIVISGHADGASVQGNTVTATVQVGGNGRAIELDSIACVLNNTVTGNQFGIFVNGGSGHVVKGNNSSGNFGPSGFAATGIHLHAVQGAVVEGNLVNNDQGGGIGTDGGGESDITVHGNNADDSGIVLYGDRHIVTDNSVLRARLVVRNGDACIVRGNTQGDRSGTGLEIGNLTGAVVEGNSVTNNTVFGIQVSGTTGSTLRGNVITGNGSAGMYVHATAAGNLVYDNLFRNALNVLSGGTGQTWSVPVAPGPNIVGGPSIGGNYWATPTGTGHSETCTDANGDGFCDDPFVIGTDNVDNLPLVLNTPPSCNPSGAGVYELGDPITLGGTVADNEGDLVTYQWREGATVLSSGTVQATQGGAPVALPDFVTALGVGTHTLQLVVDDGHILDPVTCDVVVEVIDSTAPTLAPESDCSMLWPPNHQMVSCTIEANASDNDGVPPHLDVTVTSNEPDDGLGDGDTAIDIQNILVDQTTGTITVDLRAERGGVGSGRVYTVTITATDGEGNSSMTSLTILVPRSKGQGGN